MVKYHLKRLSMPKTWLIDRKNVKFAVKPNGSGHKYNRGIPIVYVFRDLLKIADNTREVRYMIFNKGVFVDGRKIKSHKFLVGLFDTIAIPDHDVYYRLVLSDKNRINVVEVDKKEASVKLKKVVGKTVVSKGKLQLNFNDGSNLLTEDKCTVGDSVLYDLEGKKIKEVLPVAEKTPVLLLDGQYAGTEAVIEKIVDGSIFVKFDEKSYETNKSHIFVLGKTKSLIKTA